MTNRIQHSFERYEKKYMLTQRQYEIFLNRIGEKMQEDAFGRYSIGNIYYDTDDFRVIRTSLAKPAYKEKLRVRSYGVPMPEEDVFIELKKKVNGIVYKRRITVPAQRAQELLLGAVPMPQHDQIAQEIAWFQSVFHTKPKVFIGYDRTAYAGTEDSALRITFDQNMRFRTEDLNLCNGLHGMPLLSLQNILMEIKMPGACPVWLSRILSAMGIFPVSFSKYGHCYCKHILPQRLAQNQTEAYFSA